MTDALEDHFGTVSIGGGPINNLRFADDIDELAGNECELASLVEQLDKASSNFGMEIKTEMVWAHYSLIWPCQDNHAGYRKWRQKERDAEETLEDNIREWTGLELRNTLRKAEDREEWKAVVRRSAAAS
ncbi:endonuclease-reverse transcriptase [Plakobranchus ocellatus]|uniref:Endonuclease-reverse transcriptase n=1 Tax=Plakobranchus ocellatus TaxID=259542 RepID=A0AAV4ACS6_9GAST|nr:endonuclease-reverse transcriptase [Plakobranchus ocellatus]